MPVEEAEPSLTAYELDKLARIAKNNAKLLALNIPALRSRNRQHHLAQPALFLPASNTPRPLHSAHRFEKVRGSE